MIGFLEESEGVHSMSRLAILWLLTLATIVVGTLVGYMLLSPHPDPMVVGGIATILGELVWHGISAVKYRNDPDAKS